jgi:hypothetical protein
MSGKGRKLQATGLRLRVRLLSLQPEACSLQPII